MAVCMVVQGPQGMLTLTVSLVPLVRRPPNPVEYLAHFLLRNNPQKPGTE